MPSVPLRLLVAAVAIALVLPALALAAPPNPEARAFLVVNASTGEVLAARAPHARVPIASITKLMTVLVTLEHAKLSDVVRVDRNAARVGESTINLRAGERITVHDLVAAALIQSANDAAVALARYVGHGSTPAFVALMNAKARRARPPRHALRAARTGSTSRARSRAPPTSSSSPRSRCTTRRSGGSSASGRAIIAGGRTCTTWDDLLGTFPGLIGVKTGHTDNAGWCQVAAVARRTA